MIGKATEEPRVKRRYVRRKKPDVVKQKEIIEEHLKEVECVNMINDKNEDFSENSRSFSSDILLINRDGSNKQEKLINEYQEKLKSQQVLIESLERRLQAMESNQYETQFSFERSSFRPENVSLPLPQNNSD